MQIQNLLKPEYVQGLCMNSHSCHIEHQERALEGIYDRVLVLLQQYLRDDKNRAALDLGAWSGRFAEQLHNAGYATMAADVTRDAYRAVLPFTCVDMNKPDFARHFELTFDVVTAIEVIEHLENPIAFLRNIATLLNDTGIAVLTTPNLDNIPARLKYMLGGHLRAMDAAAPEHITPIFYDLLERMYLPGAGLTAMHAESYPERGFPLTPRTWLWPLFRIAGVAMRGRFLQGDSLVVVLQKTSAQSSVQR